MSEDYDYIGEHHGPLPEAPPDDSTRPEAVFESFRVALQALRDTDGDFARDAAVAAFDECIALARKWPAWEPGSGAPLRLPLGIYRHYKGGLYTALGVVFHHESRQPMVVYLSHERGTVSVRSLFGHSGDPDGWNDIIFFERDEDSEPVGTRRFEFVGHHEGSASAPEVRLK
jgi:hypothetical protein